MKIKQGLLALLAGTLLFSCNQSENPADMPNTPTSGVLKVFCEQGFTLPMQNQAYTFMQIYGNSKVQVDYLNENEVVQGLFHDSCKAIVLPRKLSEAELKKFEKVNLFPKQVCIAKSALAFIVAQNSPDTSFTLSAVLDILSGKDTSRNIVFDNANSAATRFVKDSLLQGKPFGKNCYAASSTTEMLEKVATGKQVIGVIDYAWIGDKDQTQTKDILKQVRPLALARRAGMNAYYPDQSNIETRDYPLCRYVYMARRSDDFTLATGFIAFVAGPKGQLMLLKGGFVPAFRQERVIEANTTPLTAQ